MDRTPDCGSGNPGSIPGRGTIRQAHGKQDYLFLERKVISTPTKLIRNPAKITK